MSLNIYYIVYYTRGYFEFEISYIHSTIVQVGEVGELTEIFQWRGEVQVVLITLIFYPAINLYFILIGISVSVFSLALKLFVT